MIRVCVAALMIFGAVESVHAQSIRDGDLKPGDQPYFNLAFRTRGQPVTFLGGHVDEGRCERARKLVQRKLNEMKWGRAVCLPQLQP